MSRFRLGLLLGITIGYVLGAQAGRERYEQIRRAWRSLLQSDSAHQLADEVRSAAARAGDAVEGKASEGVAKVTEMVRGTGAAGSRP